MSRGCVIADDDPCEPAPCQNGGVCNQGNGSCDCTGTGFMGTTCQGNLQVLTNTDQTFFYSGLSKATLGSVRFTMYNNNNSKVNSHLLDSMD